MAPRRSSYRPPSKTDAKQIVDLVDPRLLNELLTFPSVLYVAGDAELLNSTRRRVSIVGSRDASEAGVRRSAKLAKQLAEAGIVVVSGMAKGIDHAAHTAAIDAHGKTIAVIGTPLDKAYPASHAALQEQIYRDHLLVSQFSLGTKVFPSNFVARNRTMALLSDASVIVEAGNTSGSLSQAAETQRLGRPLFIMKSIIENPELTWPKRFLDAGAHVLDDVQQVLNSLVPWIPQHTS